MISGLGRVGFGTEVTLQRRTGTEDSYPAAAVNLSASFITNWFRIMAITEN